jgi:4-hydroxy-2-oxoheptanedioate aldolase
MIGERLNGMIGAWEKGGHVFAAFSRVERQAAIEMCDAPYEGVIYEMEHNPYDAAALGDALQYMLSRRTIASAKSLSPQVTPLARIPANGTEMNQFLAKQVLDRGVYGVLWPHVATADQAYNAVAACRYARQKETTLYEPKGVRGDGPAAAARYWGLTQAEYYARADVWPLAPHGEILVGLMIESLQAIENLNEILNDVPGIGFLLIGEGDLSQELGCPRNYDHPVVREASREILAIAKRHDVIVGNPRVTAGNYENLIDEGYRLLLAAPERSYGVIERARAFLASQIVVSDSV